MDDMILRAAAIEAAIDGADDWDGGYNSEREGYIMEHMAKVPAVDAAPVVRCKDCRHRGSNKICVKLLVGTKDRFFCAFGEWRDSE